MTFLKVSLRDFWSEDRRNGKGCGESVWIGVVLTTLICASNPAILPCILRLSVWRDRAVEDVALLSNSRDVNT